MKTMKTLKLFVFAYSVIFLALEIPARSVQADFYRWVTPNGTFAFGDFPAANAILPVRINNLDDLGAFSLIVDESGRYEEANLEEPGPAEEESLQASVEALRQPKPTWKQPECTSSMRSLSEKISAIATWSGHILPGPI